MKWVQQALVTTIDSFRNDEMLALGRSILVFNLVNLVVNSGVCVAWLVKHCIKNAKVVGLILTY